MWSGEKSQVWSGESHRCGQEKVTGVVRRKSQVRSGESYRCGLEKVTGMVNHLDINYVT